MTGTPEKMQPEPTVLARGIARMANFFIFLLGLTFLSVNLTNPLMPSYPLEGPQWVDEILLPILLMLGIFIFFAALCFSLFQLASACQHTNRSLLCGGIWKTLLLSSMMAFAVMLPPSSTARGTALAMQNTNNLKQLQFALLNYARTHDGQLPPHWLGYEPDGNGIYPHSWRVHILPFMEQKWLYEQIRLNEPWDSEWNRQFHDQMPLTFQNPFFSQQGMRYANDLETQPKPSETSYCLVKGPSGNMLKNGEETQFFLAESALGCWMDPAHDISMEDVRKNGLDTQKGFRTYYRKLFFIVSVSDLLTLRVQHLTREELEESLHLGQRSETTGSNEP